MKKFLVILLSLAVLFGFAACDNSTSNSGSGNIADVAYVEGAVRNAVTYFDGEKADASDFIFTGYNIEGNVAVADMASTLFGEGTVDAAKDTVTFAYLGGSVVISDVPVYTLDAIGVELVGTQSYFVNSSIKDIKDDYKVTGYALEDADDGESAVVYSRELADDEYTIEYTADFVDTTSAKFTKAGDVTLTFKSTYNDSAIAYGDPADKNNTAEISVKLDYVTGFSVAQKENSAVVGATIGSAEDYVEVTYTMASGTTTTTGTATSKFVEAIASDAKFESNKTYTVEVTVSVNGTNETKSQALTLVENALVSFEVTYSTDIENGTTISLDDVSISSLTWRDDTTAPAEIDEDYLKTYLQMTNTDTGAVVEEYEVNGFGEGAKLPLAFSLTGDYASATCDTVLTTKAGA